MGVLRYTFRKWNWSLHSFCRINHGFGKERLQVCNLAESGCLKEGGKGGPIKQMRWSELNWTVSGSLLDVGFVVSSDEPSFPVTKGARDSIWFGWVARQSGILVYIVLGSFVQDIYTFHLVWIRTRQRNMSCMKHQFWSVMKTLIRTPHVVRIMPRRFSDSDHISVEYYDKVLHRPLWSVSG
jgi:hypothetical protein